MTTTPHPVLSEDTRIPLKFMLVVLAVIVLPAAGVGLHVVRALDAIKLELVLLRGHVTRQGVKVDVAVTSSEFRAYLREARANGYPDLPPFLTD